MEFRHAFRQYPKLHKGHLLIGPVPLNLYSKTYRSTERKSPPPRACAQTPPALHLAADRINICLSLGKTLFFLSSHLQTKVIIFNPSTTQNHFSLHHQKSLGK